MSRPEETNQYSIFWPKTTKSLTTDYPELKKYINTAELSPSQVLFVWFHSCKSSPLCYSTKNEGKRIRKCLDAAFGDRMEDNDKEHWCGEGWPDKIGQAMRSMSRFEPGPRIRAKLMIEKIMMNMEEVSAEKMTADMFVGEDGQIDFGKKKQYIEMQAKISTSINGLVEQLEGQFSVAKVDEKDKNLGSFIDDWHEQNN